MSGWVKGSGKQVANCRSETALPGKKFVGNRKGDSKGGGRSIRRRFLCHEYVGGRVGNVWRKETLMGPVTSLKG